MATEQRLIDANALITLFEKEVQQSTYPYFHLDEIVDEIIHSTTVDAVEVVRCKDCKHYLTIHCTCDGCCISDDWYCADGERRTDNEKS